MRELEKEERENKQFVCNLQIKGKGIKRKEKEKTEDGRRIRQKHIKSSFATTIK